MALFCVCFDQDNIEFNESPSDFLFFISLVYAVAVPGVPTHQHSVSYITSKINLRHIENNYLVCSLTVNVNSATSECDHLYSV